MYIYIYIYIDPASLYIVPRRFIEDIYIYDIYIYIYDIYIYI